MFLDADGKPDPAKSRHSGLAVGVPGTVAGLALAEKKYGSGKFTLAELIAPAIKLAQEGFPVEDHVADTLPRMKKRLGRWPSSAAIFFKNGEPLHEGDRLVQPDLAETLQAIAQHGPDAFYRGRIAEQIAAAVQRGRRHHDRRRSRALPRGRARAACAAAIAATTSSPCRRRPPAA